MRNMHAILVALFSASHIPEQADHAAREVLNQHAHELAEKIRNGNPDRTSDWSDGVDWAADLIDPEATP
jgi:hypothetical protein